MAKVYLDANKVIDLIVRNPAETSGMLTGHQVYTSPLSYHILYYVERIKVPSKSVAGTLSQVEIVSLDQNILLNSQEGPTNDLEDNIQLHSAAEKECDYFLTNDKNLLSMKFFGKSKIMGTL